MTTTLKSDTLPVTSKADVVTVRQAVRKLAVELKLSLVEQTKMVTAASELARNMLIYGGGGVVTMNLISWDERQGLEVQFLDQGAGIADVALALRDGYTSGNGLGLGLGGAKRLVHQFEITSKPGEGTHVVITRWR